MRGLAWLAMVTLCAATAACSGEDTAATPRKTGSLVDHHLWVLLEGADDPYLSERPPDVSCPAERTIFEDFGGEESFGVDTQYCDYVSVGQPSLLPVLAGDKLQIRVWHFALTAPDPGEAHVAVMLDGSSLFDAKYPIPSDSGLDFPVVEAPADAAQGSTVVFHVHNHGDNSFSFIELSIKELAP